MSDNYEIDGQYDDDEADEAEVLNAPFPKTLPYCLFKQRHPTYDADSWKIYRALYEGGEKLGCDSAEGKEILKRLLPQHVGEEDDVYQKRLQFALYIPYAGQIVDFIIASLSSDPLTVSAEPELDDWYTEFLKDTSAPGGCKEPFEELLRKQMLTALICRRAWLLVDLPKVFDSESQASSLAEQEAAGALDAYLVPIEPENVIDWEETDDGLLQWALVYRRVQKRKGLTDDRDCVSEEFTYFTADRWARYCIEWNTKQKSCPDDQDPVFLEDEGDHTFGRVPLLSLELSAGLHALGKVAPLARSHFNKRSALDWGEYRSAFQFLVAKLAPEDAIDPVSSDPNRAVNQRIGHGRVMVLAKDDSLEYLGPSSEPFRIIMDDLNNLRDEMHRVLHHMALSVDNSAAALQRSGSSKAQDSAATAVVLKALGSILRAYAVEVCELVAVAHGDADKYEIQAHGVEEFDGMSLHDFLEELATLNEINIPSETWKRLYMFKAAKLSLGGGVDDETLNQIRDELEKNISAEEFDDPIPPPLPQMQEMPGEPMPEEVPPAKAPKPKKAKAPKVSKPKAPTATGESDPEKP